jgi:hypothetical protein
MNTTLISNNEIFIYNHQDANIKIAVRLEETDWLHQAQFYDLEQKLKATSSEFMVAL